MDQLYELICVQPFGDIKKGQHITDPDEVEKHIGDREHHFIRIAKPAPIPPEPVHAAEVPFAAPAPAPIAKIPTK